MTACPSLQRAYGEVLVYAGELRGINTWMISATWQRCEDEIYGLGFAQDRRLWLCGISLTICRETFAGGIPGSSVKACQCELVLLSSQYILM